MKRFLIVAVAALALSGILSACSSGGGGGNGSSSNPQLSGTVVIQGGSNQN